MSDSEPSIGARLRGDGAKITFADGSVHEVRFDFDAIVELEENLGSLDVFTTLLQAGTRGKLFRAVAAGVAAGLLHTGETMTPANARLVLDAARIREYRDALTEAMVRAMPPDSDDGDDGDDGEQGKASAPASDSLGAPSTHSAPSGSDEAMLSSGA